MSGNSNSGRKPTKWNMAQVRAMGSCGAPYEHMATFFGVSERTIRREMKKVPKEGNFVHAYNEGSAGQNIKILQHVYSRAMKNDKVLMFLLKCKLGWSEKIPEGSQEVTIRHVDASGKQVDGLPQHLIPFPDRDNVPEKTKEA